jgi:class 3 adenylate cyclase
VENDTLSPGGVAGERRLVTILFCDLVGSTVLSQRLDQEDYAELVLSYQELLSGIIVANGGIVANYMGDGVVGQFGYPDAHENDAERAVVSGLEVCEAVIELDRTLGAELGEAIECRIGAHTSVSVVGTMGAGRSDMSIFGDTANIASRVEGVAAPGQIYATSSVLDLLRGEYETADHKVVELKGVAEPTEVARIVGRAAARLDDDALLHLGRADVIAQLVAAWKLTRNGSGHAITISGEGGLGKSALVRSLVNRATDPSIVIGKGRALAQAESFGVLRQLAEAAQQDHAQSAPAANVVLEQLNRPATDNTKAEARWQAAFDAGMTLLESLTTSPTMVIVEDLHWTDASTIDLLTRFAKGIDQRAGLLLTTTRPGPAIDNATTIELGPLGDDDLRRLVEAHATADLPAEVIDSIVARAEGVPLFAVELARGATAGASVAVPESLQASLLARLAFRPELSRTAQLASVLGDVVDTSLLGALTEADVDLDDILEQLDDAHILERDDKRSWQFTHSLLREAVYSSMLRRDRRRLHQQIAAILTDDGGRDDHRLSLIGHHLVLGSRAIEGAACYDAAARRTASLGAAADAVELAELGLAALGDSAETSDELLGLTMTKGNALNAAVGYNGDGLYDLWVHTEAMAETLGNQLEQSSGMNGQSVIALFDGEYDLAIERADRILAFGDTHRDRVARLRAQCSRALPQLYKGAVTESLESSRAAIDLYADGDYELVTYGFGTDQLVIAQTTAATAGFFADDPTSDAHSQAAIEHARSLESPISIAMSLNQAGMLAMFDDDPDAALGYVDEVWEVCDSYGLPFYRMVSTLTRAAALGRKGDEGARDLAYTALFSGEAGGNLGLTLGFYMVALCEESCANPAAFDLAAGALDIVRERDERVLEVELLALQLRTRPSDEIVDQLTAAIDLAHSRGAHGSARRGQALL